MNVLAANTVRELGIALNPFQSSANSNPMALEALAKAVTKLTDAGIALDAPHLRASTLRNVLIFALVRDTR